MAATVLKSHLRLAWSQKVGDLGQWGSSVQAAKSVILAKQTGKAGIPAVSQSVFLCMAISFLLVFLIL